MVFSLRTIEAKRNIEKLSAMIQTAAGQLILILWQEEAFLKHYNIGKDENAVAPYSPMIDHYILGVIDEKPVLPDWEHFALPISRYLLDKNGIIQHGPINATIAAGHGFSYLELNDPEPEDYRRQSGVSVYPGDGRVLEWFAAQCRTTRPSRYQPFLDLWLACRKLEYQLDSPEIAEVMETHRELFIAEFAATLINLPEPERMAQLCEKAKELDIDLKKVYERAQKLLCHRLGIY